MTTPATAAPAASNPAPASQSKALSPRSQQERAIRVMLERGEARIAESLPQTQITLGMTAKMIVRAVLAEVSMSEDLTECDPLSVLRCAVDCARLGFLPNRVTGHVYLVPFKENWQENGQWKSRMICTVIVGYRGLIDLTRRSGNISTFDVCAVHERDEFRYQLGDDAKITHVPYQGGEDPGHMIAAYTIVRLRDGGIQRCVMTTREIDAIKARAKSSRNPKAPWHTDYDEMAKKTTIRRISKLLPISIEALNLIERDRIRDEGTEEERKALGLDPETGMDLPESPDAQRTFDVDPTTGEVLPKQQPQHDAPKTQPDAGVRQAALQEFLELASKHEAAVGELWGGQPPLGQMDAEEIRQHTAALAKAVGATAKPAGKGGSK